MLPVFLVCKLLINISDDIIHYFVEVMQGGKYES